jgi:hypothetical protein
LRDHVIEKLIDEGIFVKQHIFAKKNSNGVEYLEGYIKTSPTHDSKNMPFSIEDTIKFANLLATYDLTLEEYINSFNNKKPFVNNASGSLIKRILNRTDIRLTSYLFSNKFVDFVNNNSFYSQRFIVNDDAICCHTEHMLSTTSHSR